MRLRQLTRTPRIEGEAVAGRPERGTWPVRQRPRPVTTQERILCVIRQHITEHGQAPAMQQIGAAVSMRSRASVHYQLTELETKPAIVREPRRSREIRLT
ncbi:hypothetical protein [Streptomyces sp. NPDC047841]|uniref:LexA family protein n=1 Tax=Streptomyces sp. NPDC047841 TaxID=3154708 RepID=UPI0034533DE6